MKAVIFDMDGTILDTLSDLTAATNYALGKYGERHDFPPFLVGLCYGSGITADMEKCLALARGCIPEDLEFIGNRIPLSAYGFTSEDVKKLEEIFSPYYASHNHIRTAPYKGIPEVLSALRNQGIKTAVASNKNDSDVQTLASSLFPSGFDAVIGNSPSIRRKPSPDMVLAILEKLSISKEEALYVGDTETDFETAQNAGVKCLAVDWGFRTVEFLKGHGAEIIIHEPLEILSYV
jgi:phosphoglycolate phosphatase